jgi:hypothetical protein
MVDFSSKKNPLIPMTNISRGKTCCSSTSRTDHATQMHKHTMTSTTSSSSSSSSNNNYYMIFLQTVLSSWIERAPDLASRMSSLHPYIQSIPNQNTTTPFVFFHTRKAAGSTLRNAINQSSFENNSTAWIPCFTPGHPCVPYSLPPTDHVYDVYASHVNYMRMVQILSEISGSDQSPMARYTPTVNVSLEHHGKYAEIHYLNDSNPLFNCMTSLRPTVSRVVSCWNFRMVEEKLSKWNIPSSDELSPQDWDRLLPVTYDRYSNGCNNEIVRIFTSRVSETYVNSISQQLAQEEQQEYNAAIVRQEFEEIASRLSQCVVIMNHRCEESNIILSHFLPWIKSRDLCRNRVNVGNVSESVNGLQPGAAEVILSQNYLDEMLFQFGEALFEAQLRIAKNATQRDDNR